MNAEEIIRRRLRNQCLTGTLCATAGETVGWFGAVQSQEYWGAKWGLAQRLANAVTNQQLDDAFNRGELLRTHAMRPTWHFVAPEDIRWMLMLTAPKVKRVVATPNSKLGINEALVEQAGSVLKEALRGGKQVTRNEARTIVREAGLSPDQNLSHIDQQRWFNHLLMMIELNGVICSGSLRGKQHTYALLEERVPPAPVLDPEAALAELARRYFTSHGPAAFKDFAWWSGLLAGDARHALELLQGNLNEVKTGDGVVYYYIETEGVPIPLSEEKPLAHLLPAFDEYTLAYKDAAPFLLAEHNSLLRSAFESVFLFNGRIAGAWKRTLANSSVSVELRPFRQLNEAETEALAEAVQRYGAFLELEVELVIQGVVRR